MVGQRPRTRFRRVGTCGKEGQSVPVGVGQPTLEDRRADGRRHRQERLTMRPDINLLRTSDRESCELAHSGDIRLRYGWSRVSRRSHAHGIRKHDNGRRHGRQRAESVRLVASQRDEPRARRRLFEPRSGTWTGCLTTSRANSSPVALFGMFGVSRLRNARSFPLDGGASLQDNELALGIAMVTCRMWVAKPIYESLPYFYLLVRWR